MLVSLKGDLRRHFLLDQSVFLCTQTATETRSENREVATNREVEVMSILNAEAQKWHRLNSLRRA